MATTTPKRPGRGNPSTPSSGATSQSVMDCSWAAEDFSIIEIHTAKCAKCDKRNMDKMRRCPGCTYQVCNPCYTRLGDDALKHGNQIGQMMSSLPATPKRRIPWDGKANKVGDTVANITEGMSTPVSITANTSVPSSTLKNLGIGGKEFGEGFMEDLTPVKQRSSERKRKPTRVIPSDSGDDVGDGDFLPGGGESKSPSPSPSLSKRVKQTTTDHISTPRPRRAARSTTISKFNLTQRPPAMPDFSAHLSQRLPSPQPSEGGEAGGDVFGGGPELAGGANNPEPARGSLSAQQLLDRVRADLGMIQPSIEPLIRERPLDNPRIRIPPNVARNFKPRPTSPEIQQNIQNRVRAKLEAKQAEAGATRPSSENPFAQATADTQTVRQLVRLEASKLYHDIDIDEDQKSAVEISMRETARKLTIKYKEDAPPYFSNQIPFGLDMLVVQLGGRQREELVRACWETGSRVVNEFKEELAAHTPKARAEKELPPVGMYQVSPPKLMPLAPQAPMVAASPSVQRLAHDLNAGGSDNGHAGQDAVEEEHRSSTERVQH